ncbi:MAG: hypothetical protein RMY28_006695 [Nostoc sp. ChiSLP01]
MNNYCITSAASTRFCTPSPQPRAASPAMMTDMVWLVYPTPATANPQTRHGRPLDVTAVIEGIAVA